VCEAARQTLAEQAAHAAAGMRLAGGSVMPPLPTATRRAGRATLEMLAESDDEQRTQFRRLSRRCLPGFALVSRDDLLRVRLAEMQAEQPQTTALDAWLDLSRWNHRAVQNTDEKGDTSTTWQTDKRAGWTVPIPVGYAGLSDLHAPGTVAGARDSNTPFRFVESLWSIGQWVGPHRLRSLDDLLWYAQVEGEKKSIYRCRNDYTAPPSEAEAATTAAAH
jgi:CRISPR-associated protein Csy2